MSWECQSKVRSSEIKKGVACAIQALDGTSEYATHRWPVALPDGKHFLYFASSHITPLSEQNGIYIASFDGQLNRFLVPTPSGGGYADGNFSSSRSPPSTRRLST